MNQSRSAGKRLRFGACLSLTGKYSRFGKQAALGLRAWQSLAQDILLTVEDDGSEPGRLRAGIRRLTRSSDLLLGPYSTAQMRAAGPVAKEIGCLLWNHGSAGDDVQAAWPGRIVSVLTPASRYATPWLRRLTEQVIRAPLWIVEGRGSFGKQVADGAQQLAGQLGLQVERLRPQDRLPSVEEPQPWDLLCSGSFEEDVARVTEARRLAWPPRLLCAVGAGVHDFGVAVANPEGVYGVAQWVAGYSAAPSLGPTEEDFLAAYSRLAGGPPSYPAVQSAAAAVIATHCADVAASVEPESLWRAAARLETSTMFGRFRIDAVSGVQIQHETALIRWSSEHRTLRS